uniref:Uncharacterized protein n=1 Tax=Anopheles farauti TaxID=69004 RepID=A0A182QQ44_9DIPT
MPAAHMNISISNYTPVRPRIVAPGEADDIQAHPTSIRWVPPSSVVSLPLSWFTAVVLHGLHLPDGLLDLEIGLDGSGLDQGRVEGDQLEADEQTVLTGGGLIVADIGCDRQRVAHADLRHEVLVVEHEQIGDEFERLHQMLQTLVLLVHALPATVEALVVQSLDEILVLVVAVATVLVVAHERIDQQDDERFVRHRGRVPHSLNEAVERGADICERRRHGAGLRGQTGRGEQIHHVKHGSHQLAVIGRGRNLGERADAHGRHHGGCSIGVEIRRNASYDVVSDFLQLRHVVGRFGGNIAAEGREIFVSNAEITASSCVFVVASLAYPDVGAVIGLRSVTLSFKETVSTFIAVILSVASRLDVGPYIRDVPERNRALGKLHANRQPQHGRAQLGVDEIAQHVVLVGEEVAQRLVGAGDLQGKKRRRSSSTYRPYGHHHVSRYLTRSTQARLIVPFCSSLQMVSQSSTSSKSNTSVATSDRTASLRSREYTPLSISVWTIAPITLLSVNESISGRGLDSAALSVLRSFESRLATPVMSVSYPARVDVYLANIVSIAAPTSGSLYISSAKVGETGDARLEDAVEGVLGRLEGASDRYQHRGGRR